MFRVCAFGMTECFHVARQQEIEWLNLFHVGLTVIQFGERFDQRWTAHSHAAYGRPVFKFQIPCREL